MVAYPNVNTFNLSLDHASLDSRIDLMNSIMDTVNHTGLSETVKLMSHVDRRKKTRSVSSSK